MIFAFLSFLTIFFGASPTEYIYSNGDVYVGNMKDGRLEGQGKLFYANGDFYEGEWVNNQKNGKGRLVWSNGRSYQGQFLNNECNGKGRHWFSYGDYIEGKWKEGHLIEFTQGEDTKTLLCAVNHISLNDDGGFPLRAKDFLSKTLQTTAQIQSQDRKLLLSVSQALDSSQDPYQSIQNGHLTILGTGWREHSIFAVFYKDYMLICNRGEGRQDYTTKMYHITSEKLKKSDLDRFSNDLNQPSHERLAFIYQEFPALLHAKRSDFCAEFEKKLNTSDQKVGNCWYASCKEAVKGAFALLLLEKGQSIEGALDLSDLCTAVSRVKLLHEYQEKVARGATSSIDPEVLSEIKQKSIVYQNIYI